MTTPYITPDILINAPTGISWETIPNYESTLTEQLAEQTRICWRATHWIDEYCNQPLRSTLDTEEILGPNFRVTIQPNGLVRFLPSRWPITDVSGGQYSASNAVPPQWTTIPADAMYIENTSTVNGSISTVAAAGPSTILIAPGYVTWGNGRRGYRLQITYTDGFAHAGITTNCNIGATTLSVDDCTGMVNATVVIHDGAATETVVVSAASAASGPGMITLKTGTVYPHAASLQKPLIISGIPASVQQAAINYATYITLTRGATATTVQMMPGMSTGGGGSASLLTDAKEILLPYRRVF